MVKSVTVPLRSVISNAKDVERALQGTPWHKDLDA
jgi:hypothetical protein